MSVTATISAGLQADDTTTAALDLATVTVPHRLSQTETLGAATSPAVSKVWSDQASLTAGAATINLAALPDVNGGTLDLTGLKVQGFIIKNLSTNSNSLRVDTGATNGYNLLGAAASEVTIPIGGFVAFYAPEGATTSLPDVASGARTIDLTSSDTDLTYQIIIIAG